MAELTIQFKMTWLKSRVTPGPEASGGPIELQLSDIFPFVTGDGGSGLDGPVQISGRFLSCFRGAQIPS